MDPAGHHLVSLFFHVANTLLLFFLLNRMTQTLWQSAAVAFLFALHPLHVESVAWVAERKDVLSTFFLLLTLWAYFVYTRSPGIVRMIPVVVFFALGLLSKAHARHAALCPAAAGLLAPGPISRSGKAGFATAADAGHRIPGKKEETEEKGSRGKPPGSPGTKGALRCRGCPLEACDGEDPPVRSHDPVLDHDRPRSAEGGCDESPRRHLAAEATGQCPDLVRVLHRQDRLSAGSCRLLSLSRRHRRMAGAGIGCFDRRHDLPCHSLAGSAIPIASCRVVLVSRDAGSGDRDRPGGHAVHGRPVYLCAAHRAVHRRCLGGRRSCEPSVPGEKNPCCTHRGRFCSA